MEEEDEGLKKFKNAILYEEFSFQDFIDSQSQDEIIDGSLLLENMVKAWLPELLALESGVENTMLPAPVSRILDVFMHLCEKDEVESEIIFRLLEDLVLLSPVQFYEEIFKYILSQQDKLQKLKHFDGFGESKMWQLFSAILRKFAKEQNKELLGATKEFIKQFFPSRWAGVCRLEAIFQGYSIRRKLADYMIAAELIWQRDLFASLSSGAPINVNVSAFKWERGQVRQWDWNTCADLALRRLGDATVKPENKFSFLKSSRIWDRKNSDIDNPNFSSWWKPKDLLANARDWQILFNQIRLPVQRTYSGIIDWAPRVVEFLRQYSLSLWLKKMETLPLHQTRSNSMSMVSWNDSLAYWLEKMDPGHRDGEYLCQNFYRWLATEDQDEPFLYWLYIGEGKSEVVGEKLQERGSVVKEANHLSRKARWTFYVIMFLLELFSAACDRLSSVGRPGWALVGLILSMIALIVTLVELVWKGVRAKVKLQLNRWAPWFYYPPPHKQLFGTIFEMIELTSATGQFILAIIGYWHLSHQRENPASISLCSLILSFALIWSKDGSNQPGAVWTREAAKRFFYAVIFILEVVSAVSDRLTSESHPGWATLSLVLAWIGFMLVLLESLYEFVRGEIRFLRNSWGLWFIGPPFASFLDCIQLVIAGAQCASTTVAYYYISHHREDPLRLSMCSIIFAFFMMCRKFGYSS